MQGNFARSLAAVLVHEAGFVDNPHDPGGATNRGVTKAVYDEYRVGKGLPKQSVKLISSAEVEDIYRNQYWNACRCDDLPSGLDYCVFDFSVNSGVTRACKFLQRAVGAVDDGKLGPATLAAVKAHDTREVIEEVCEARLFFLRSRPTFKYFGKGWTKRVDGVRAKAESMA